MRLIVDLFPVQLLIIIMALAIFDLDNTLLNGDSDHAFGEFLVQQKLVDAESFKQGNDYFYQQYKNGGLDIHEFLAFALKPLSEHSLEALDALHAEFMRTVITPMRLAKADLLLQKHRDAGDFLLIITATNGFITKPIAKALGVDDILATEPEIINQRYTGKIVGEPCFQAGKITHLQQWLETHQHSLEGSYFYSDSHNDLPLLKMVDKPVAVDSDEILTDYANAQGWPVITLRD